MTGDVEYKLTKKLYEEKKSFVTNLECSITGRDDYKAGEIHGLSKAGRPLLVRYDLEAIKNSVTRKEIEARPGGFWKYREFLPVNTADAMVSLGEVMTPIMPLKASVPDGCDVLVKDEGRLPTGSFNAMGLALPPALAK